MKIRSALATAALLLLPFSAAAQQAMAEGLRLVGPGKFAGVIEETLTSTVASVDAATRTVVLMRANGERLQLIAGDRLDNFDRIQVGDRVVARHSQALVLELRKGGAGVRARAESRDKGLAKPGGKPAGYEAKQVAFVADVQKVELQKRLLTLRGATRTIRLKVEDPEQLRLIKIGDQVEGVYAEAIAISVIAAPAKTGK